MKVNSFLAAIFPSFFCCLLCGISTICPQRKNGNWFLSEKFTYKVIHLLWSYILIIILATSLVLYEDNKTYYQGLAGFVVKITKWTLIGQIFINFFFTTSNSRKLKSALEDISSAEETMKKCNIEPDYKTHFIAELSSVVLGIFYVLLIVYGGIETGNNQKISTIPTTLFALYYAAIMLLINGSRFCMLMAVLLGRYWMINKELNSLSFSTIQKFPKQVAAKIEDLFEIYFHLNKAGDKLKEINQIGFLALFAGMFLINICTLFNTYYEYYIKKNIYSAINWFQWTILVWLGFAELCFTCHLTVNEAKKTGVVLHRILIEDLNPVLSEKILHFSNHIQNVKFEFNACGFFTIDCSLFYMLIGATFNYMIIMLQFEEGNNDSC